MITYEFLQQYWWFLISLLGRPVNVYQKVTKEANWLIEEFMLLANRTVAEFVATG